ncbi:fucosyltransferase [Trichinella pseudospiralis]
MWVPYTDARITNEHLETCKELHCKITYDRSTFEKASAVVMYDHNLLPNDLPPQRRDKQHFVFFLMESPAYVSEQAFQALRKNYYTLTMTWRQDSDIYSPFGYFKKRKTVEFFDEKFWKETANNKTKLVAWMVSYCHPISKRELYVAELQKYMILTYMDIADHKNAQRQTKHIKKMTPVK